MPDQIIENFRKELCRHTYLNNREWEFIKLYFRVKYYIKKELLLTSGQLWDKYAFVISGCFRHSFLNRFGEDTVVSFSTEYNWVGDSESLISGRPSKFNIEALEKSCVILIEKTDFTMLMERIPALREILKNFHYNNFISYQYQIHAAHKLTALEKYQYFLKNQPELILRIPQGIIASYLGINPETLSRARKKTCQM